jgi:hypothetical protein
MPSLSGYALEGSAANRLTDAAPVGVREGAVILGELLMILELHRQGVSVSAIALLGRLLHHAVVFQIEGSSYRLREHADLMPEHIRTRANIQPAPIPPTLRRRGRPPKNGGADLD